MAESGRHSSAFVAGHSPPEAGQLEVRQRRSVIIFSFNCEEQLPEPCDRGILGPNWPRLERSCSGHCPPL
jgi:hypothetical protein